MVQTVHLDWNLQMVHKAAESQTCGILVALCSGDEPRGAAAANNDSSSHKPGRVPHFPNDLERYVHCTSHEGVAVTQPSVVCQVLHPFPCTTAVSPIEAALELGETARIVVLVAHQRGHDLPHAVLPRGPKSCVCKSSDGSWYRHDLPLIPYP